MDRENEWSTMIWFVPTIYITCTYAHVEQWQTIAELQILIAIALHMLVMCSAGSSLPIRIIRVKMTDKEFGYEIPSKPMGFIFD